MDDSSPEQKTPDTKEISLPSVYIFSDAIKRAMKSFADAHRQNMAAMADTNAAAFAAAVDRIAQTITPRVGHTSLEVPSHGISSSPSAHAFSAAEKGTVSPSAQAHTSQVASEDVHFCHAGSTGKRKRRGHILPYQLPP